jgi:hypothetical protein
VSLAETVPSTKIRAIFAEKPEAPCGLPISLVAPGFGGAGKTRRSAGSGYVLPAMQDLGKILVVAGLGLALLGLLVWKTGGLGPLGKLPGDISIHRGNSSFYFPIVTCLLISLVLTLLGWLFRR